MLISFCDALGVNMVRVDEYGISFSEGIAVFSDSRKEYRVNAAHIVSIQEEV